MADQIDDILTLLTLTIIADKKVVDREIDTFLQVATQVTHDLGLEKPLSQSKLLAWLYSNQGRIKPMLSSPEFDRILVDIFKRTKSVTNKPAILEKMVQIASADDEFHVSEKALIILAARHWNIEAPAFAA